MKLIKRTKDCFSSLVFRFCVCIGIASFCSLTQAAGWRNDGTGSFPAATVPLQWSEEKNVIWKTPLSRWGNASPILVDDRIFICAEPTTLICLRADNGEILWQKTNHYFETLSPGDAAKAKGRVKQADSLKKQLKTLEEKLAELKKLTEAKPQDTALAKRIEKQNEQIKSHKAKIKGVAAYRLPKAHGTNGYSSPTPTFDGKYVYVLFGTGTAACYDMQGNRKWVKFVNAPSDGWGHSASPLLVGDKLVVHIGKKVSALDRQTGQIIWTAESKPKWGSPVAVQLDDGPVVITPSGTVLRASDGQILASKIANLEYATPVFRQGILYFIEHGGKALRMPSKAGESFNAEVLWETKPKKDRYYASPIVYDGLIYAVTRASVFSAIDAKTGQVIYEEKLDLGAGTTYPSIILAGDHILVSSDNGTTIIVQPDREFRQIGKNKIGGFRSTPIIKGKHMYVRGLNHFYCIGL